MPPHSGPDPGRALPLVGISLPALLQLAANPRFDDDATTDDACRRFFKFDGLPEGWSSAVRVDPATGFCVHTYTDDGTGVARPQPPPGTRSIVDGMIELHGANNPDTLESRGNLAVTLHNLGEVQAAKV